MVFGAGKGALSGETVGTGDYSFWDIQTRPKILIYQIAKKPERYSLAFREAYMQLCINHFS